MVFDSCGSDCFNYSSISVAFCAYAFQFVLALAAAAAVAAATISPVKPEVNDELMWITPSQGI